MRRARLAVLFLSLVASLSTSCSRYAEKSPLGDAGLLISPATTDTALPLKEISLRRIGGSLQTSKELYSTADYFRLIDNLKSLAELQKDERLSSLAGNLYSAFNANQNNYLKTTFLKSPVLNAIVGEGEEPIKTELTSLRRDLLQAHRGITALLKRSETSFPWPKRVTNLQQFLDVMDNYAQWILQRLEGVEMSPEFRAVAQDQIRSQYTKYRPVFVRISEELEGAKLVSQATGSINQALKELEIRLKPEDAEKLQQADELGQQLLKMETPQDTLTVLVSVWRLIPAEEREAFRKISPELHDFLSGKSDAELNCLAKPRCLNPILGVSKLVIFQKLEGFGLQKIHDQVESAATAALVELVRNELTKIIPQVPSLIREPVDLEVGKYNELIGKVLADIRGFAQSRISNWATVNFNESLRSFEISKLRVTITNRDALEVAPAVAQAKDKDILETGAETIGTSLSLAHRFLPQDNESNLRAAVMQPILKVLAIGGFRQANGKPFRNFLLPINGRVDRVFELKNLMRDSVTFAVPDQFQVNSSFVMDRLHARKDVSVAAQAELLRGISRQIRFHRDWERNEFESSLGRVLIEDVIPEVPKGAVKTPLIPKDIIFSLGLANAATVLQNLILELSPAFLMMENGQTLWGNQYQEIKGNKISTVAGMVSILNGARDSKVRTGDIARYVLALDEFMAATEGMENTKAGPLKMPTNGGKSTLLNDLLDTRKKLQLLQMALTNYLVKVAQQPDGSIHSLFSAKEKVEKLPDSKRLEDQALCIRALLASAKRLELPLYRWSALDIYYAMNRSLFDQNRQFYYAELGADGKSNKAAGIRDVVLALLAGQELAEFMPNDTREQWERLSSRWIRSLQDL